MASTNKDTITLTAHCLCKANVYTTDILKSELPLSAHTCHCTSCRHLTGALYTSETRWPEPRSNVDVSKLKIYKFSSRINLLFCPTCSTPVFWATSSDENRLLGVFTGVLTNHDDLVKFSNHDFVGDTLDGGASVWLRHPNADGTEVKRFKLDSDTKDAEELPEDWPSPAELTGYEAKKEDAVPIRCRCKGVDLVLHRGDYSGVKKEELPFNIDPKTHKLLADFCGCDSCRLQSGIDTFYWTFSEMKHISFGSHNGLFPTNKTELKKLVDAQGPSVGTLTYYASSPHVDRFFCSTCSACIFFTSDNRPELLDIAVGVLDASDGARAEGLLSWTYGAELSYREDGDGGWREGLFTRVETDAEDYRKARGYPKNWKRISDEDAALNDTEK
ncbi:uncharacterized protein K460DRAFT_407604 [Cucurbitaria berberidis CBS 394.84]|uniref:CENP-V/GFA domain-containing protein n=1 Tax=Cucurbitaria berberidis CBS 394.84 TaxID=1168544 RepID=A0A9P4GCU8_9PLEO|nr:uncharacterized protein K460DRAFT_407604 [Cucurbitaria berberidis CBS 394.84]KAF1843240.1 hypothetical protein K460DRAFT_407604 [Cucurbitaria berberidis CBS 394.84]